MGISGDVVTGRRAGLFGQDQGERPPVHGYDAEEWEGGSNLEYGSPSGLGAAPAHTSLHAPSSLAPPDAGARLALAGGSGVPEDSNAGKKEQSARAKQLRVIDLLITYTAVCQLSCARYIGGGEARVPQHRSVGELCPGS